MKIRRISTLVFAFLVSLFSLNAYGQAEKHDKMHQQKMNHQDKPQMMMIGNGEMTHMCPMKGDKVFASEAGKCPKCGMILKEMTEADRKEMTDMMKTHRVVNEKGEMITEKNDRKMHKMMEGDKHEHMMMKHAEHTGGMKEMMKHDPKIKTMMMIGNGEMAYTCPMAGDKVFSDTPGKCPKCGMNLKKMSDSDKKKMEMMQKDHKVIKKKKSDQQE